MYIVSNNPNGHIKHVIILCGDAEIQGSFEIIHDEV